jgi:hypothetical protein
MERDGSESVCGHAVHLTRRALGGDDGDAGDEMSEGLAKIFFRDRRREHGLSF